MIDFVKYEKILNKYILEFEKELNHGKFYIRGTTFNICAPLLFLLKTRYLDIDKTERYCFKFYLNLNCISVDVFVGFKHNKKGYLKERFKKSIKLAEMKDNHFQKLEVDLFDLKSVFYCARK